MDFNIILATLFFFFPAYLANAVPPLLNKIKLIPSLAVPIDNNKTIKGKRILGSHKTWRGVLGILIVGTFLIVLFFELNNYIHLYEVIGFDALKWNSFVFGIFFSLGVVFGDLLFAFLKRQLEIKPGAPFIPFDQTNYVFGTFFLLQPFLHLEISIWLIIFMQTFLIHSIFNRMGYVLDLHNAKW